MSIAAVLANEQPWHVEVGDVLRGLSRLPDGCLQSVVTSPPYFGLRSYLPTDHPDKALEMGSEPDPEAFIARLVEVLAAVRRAMRDDGTLWLNLGDTYDTGTATDATKPGDLLNMPHRVAAALQADGWYWRSTIVWSKPSPMPESISGVRWQRCRVKIANGACARMGERTGSGFDCRETELAKWQPCPGCAKCLPNDGYVLRRGKWRPTNAHEYIFLLTKSERYFCNGDAVKEPVSDPKRAASGNKEKRWGNNHTAIRSEGTGEVERHSGIPWAGETRNPRSVWTFASESEKARHFATFPSALPRKCLTAATSPAGCCPACGACYAPVVESERVPTRPGNNSKVAGANSRIYQDRDSQHSGTYREERFASARLEVGNRDPQRHVFVSRLTGYRATCDCKAGAPVPSLVCDIFSGSGTTGRVAHALGLRYIGFELSEEYAAISREKIVRPFKTAKAGKKIKVAVGQGRLFE